MNIKNTLLNLLWQHRYVLFESLSLKLNTWYFDDSIEIYNLISGKELDENKFDKLNGYRQIYENMLEAKKVVEFKARKSWELKYRKDDSETRKKDIISVQKLYLDLCDILRNLDGEIKTLENIKQKTKSNTQ